MDPDEIAKLCDRLRLDIEAAPKVFVKTSDSKPGFEKLATSLVGRVLGSKTANRKGIENVLRLIWKTRFPFKIEARGGHNTFWFQFGSEEDRDSVFNRGPWLFDKQIISLVKPAGAGYIQSMSFNVVPFWVHILNLPLILLTEKCVQSVGSSIGEVLAVDLDGMVPRVKVAIDVSKPLTRGIRVFLEAMGEEFTLPLQYERLPVFCFDCGVIGHRSCECSSPNDGLSVNKFGEWMRAITDGDRKKTGRRSSNMENNVSSSEHQSEGSADKGEISLETNSSSHELENVSSPELDYVSSPDLIFNVGLSWLDEFD